MWLKIATLYTATHDLLKSSREMAVYFQRQRFQNHRWAFIGTPLVNMDDYCHHEQHSSKHEQFLESFLINNQWQNNSRCHACPADAYFYLPCFTRDTPLIFNWVVEDSAA